MFTILDVFLISLGIFLLAGIVLLIILILLAFVNATIQQYYSEKSDKSVRKIFNNVSSVTFNLIQISFVTIINSITDFFIDLQLKITEHFKSYWTIYLFLAIIITGSFFIGIYQKETMIIINETYIKVIKPITSYLILPILNIIRIIYDLIIPIYNFILALSQYWFNFVIKVVTTTEVYILIINIIEQAINVIQSAVISLLTWIQKGIVKTDFNSYIIFQNVFDLLVKINNIVAYFCGTISDILKIVINPLTDPNLSKGLESTIDSVLYIVVQMIPLSVENRVRPTFVPFFEHLIKALIYLCTFIGDYIQGVVMGIIHYVEHFGSYSNEIETHAPSIYNKYGAVNIPVAPLLKSVGYTAASLVSIVNTTLDAFVNIDNIFKGIYNEFNGGSNKGESLFAKTFLENSNIRLYLVNATINLDSFFNDTLGATPLRGFYQVPSRAIKCIYYLFFTVSRLIREFLFEIKSNPLINIRQVYETPITSPSFFGELKLLINAVCAGFYTILTSFTKTNKEIDYSSHLTVATLKILSSGVNGFLYVFVILFKIVGALLITIVCIIELFIDIIINIDNIILQIGLNIGSYIQDPSSFFNIYLRLFYDSLDNIAILLGDIFYFTKPNYCRQHPDAVCGHVLVVFECSIGHTVTSTSFLAIEILKQAERSLKNLYAARFCGVLPQWNEKLRPQLFQVIYNGTSVFSTFVNIGFNAKCGSSSCLAQRIASAWTYWLSWYIVYPVDFIALIFDWISDVTICTPPAGKSVSQQFIKMTISQLNGTLISLVELTECVTEENQFIVTISNALIAFSDNILPLIADVMENSIELFFNFISFKLEAAGANILRIIRDLLFFILYVTWDIMKFILTEILKILPFNPICIICEIVKVLITPVRWVAEVFGFDHVGDINCDDMCGSGKQPTLPPIPPIPPLPNVLQNRAFGTTLINTPLYDKYIKFTKKIDFVKKTIDNDLNILEKKQNIQQQRSIFLNNDNNNNNNSNNTNRGGNSNKLIHDFVYWVDNYIPVVKFKNIFDSYPIIYEYIFNVIHNNYSNHLLFQDKCLYLYSLIHNDNINNDKFLNRTSNIKRKIQIEFVDFETFYDTCSMLEYILLPKSNTQCTSLVLNGTNWNHYNTTDKNIISDCLNYRLYITIINKILFDNYNIIPVDLLNNGKLYIFNTIMDFIYWIFKTIVFISANIRIYGSQTLQYMYNINSIRTIDNLIAILKTNIIYKTVYFHNNNDGDIRTITIEYDIIPLFIYNRMNISNIDTNRKSDNKVFIAENYFGETSNDTLHLNETFIVDNNRLTLIITFLNQYITEYDLQYIYIKYSQLIDHPLLYLYLRSKLQHINIINYMNDLWNFTINILRTLANTVASFIDNFKKTNNTLLQNFLNKTNKKRGYDKNEIVGFYNSINNNNNVITIKKYSVIVPNDSIWFKLFRSPNPGNIKHNKNRILFDPNNNNNDNITNIFVYKPLFNKTAEYANYICNKTKNNCILRGGNVISDCYILDSYIKFIEYELTLITHYYTNCSVLFFEQFKNGIKDTKINPAHCKWPNKFTLENKFSPITNAASTYFDIVFTPIKKKLNNSLLHNVMHYIYKLIVMIFDGILNVLSYFSNLNNKSKNNGGTRNFGWYIENFMSCKLRGAVYCSLGGLGLFNGLLAAFVILILFYLFTEYIYPVPYVTYIIATVFPILILMFAYLWTPLCLPQIPTCLFDDIYYLISTYIFPPQLYWGCFATFSNVTNKFTFIDCYKDVKVQDIIDNVLILFFWINPKIITFLKTTNIPIISDILSINIIHNKLINFNVTSLSCETKYCFILTSGSLLLIPLCIVLFLFALRIASLFISAVIISILNFYSSIILKITEYAKEIHAKLTFLIHQKKRTINKKKKRN